MAGYTTTFEENPVATAILSSVNATYPALNPFIYVTYDNALDGSQYASTTQVLGYSDLVTLATPIASLADMPDVSNPQTANNWYLIGEGADAQLFNPTLGFVTEEQANGFIAQINEISQEKVSYLSQFGTAEERRNAAVDIGLQPIPLSAMTPGNSMLDQQALDADIQALMERGNDGVRFTVTPATDQPFTASTGLVVVDGVTLNIQHVDTLLEGGTVRGVNLSSSEYQTLQDLMTSLKDAGVVTEAENNGLVTVVDGTNVSPSTSISNGAAALGNDGRY